MENKCVSNTGPIIHLSEINSLNNLEIFSEIFIPKEVENELNKNNIKIPKRIKTEELNPEWKDKIKFFIEQYVIDMGESAAISLAFQKKINYFITDDLNARIAAKNLGLEVHGSIGIILRAFREKLLNKAQAIEKVRELHSKSSLFITIDLVNQVISAIENFSKER